jgi:UDP-N-acetylglucosamine 2-epimerase (non-hydrolysing)/GDP/UDP-N,N'-diacetylbacillosamine 2-epimerase (hydrolysing)
MIAAGSFASPQKLTELYGINPQKPVVLFTQHSVTTRFEDAVIQVKPSLAALERLANEGVQVIITYPNNDAGGRRIIEEIDRFGERKIPNMQIHKSLGRYN